MATQELLQAAVIRMYVFAGHPCSTADTAARRGARVRTRQAAAVDKHACRQTAVPRVWKAAGHTQKMPISTFGIATRVFTRSVQSMACLRSECCTASWPQGQQHPTCIPDRLACHKPIYTHRASPIPRRRMPGTPSASTATHDGRATAPAPCPLRLPNRPTPIGNSPSPQAGGRPPSACRHERLQLGLAWWREGGNERLQLRGMRLTQRLDLRPQEGRRVHYLHTATDRTQNPRKT